jgi:hypothetical protein
LALSLCFSTPLLAAASDWEFEGKLYVWGAQLDITTPNGLDLDIPFHTILDTLNMTLMGEFAARNDQWSFTNDLVYLDIEQEEQRETPFPDPHNQTISGSLGMKSWIVTPTVGYALHNSDKARVEIVGGLRYLWIENQLRIVRGDVAIFDKSASVDYTDGVIGMRANINLNENWFMPLYADIGGGSSDGTWQAQAGIGYNFSKFSTSLTYRYLDYEFDDNDALAELVTKGLILSFNFKF